MTKAPQPQKNKTAAAAAAAQTAFPTPTLQQVQVAQQMYQGPIPHPSILEGFERLVPGSANRLIAMAEAESLHRRALEDRALAANVAGQEKQLSIVEYQSKVVFWSDTIGQIAGTLVSLACVAGAVWLAANGHEAAAGALAAIPGAALIRSFFSPRKTPQQAK
ncbi:DUF2335 domain-containing protein [Ralstonia solanacearum]|nr:DUF2335 domain-containing protein [Ralstonia solanacearum]QKL76645.1 DUF2335 domain-containing protein [Ralstonia solanacearum]QKL81849.1 DUF2335 domain-containing protein [Ralstonia solanacearum]QKL87060.1 DUF2335 domain-containing protein [Ralstonia solanacearum]QKM02426.1 DUF2335 domain-containing protein [Ralstonia solanacearum]